MQKRSCSLRRGRRPAVREAHARQHGVPGRGSDQRLGVIDLVVTDVMMPGCGGPELLSRLQVHRPDLKVLYMSGYTAQSTANKTGIDRGLPFLQKPFTAGGLVKHVQDALDRQPDGSAAK